MGRTYRRNQDDYGYGRPKSLREKRRASGKSSKWEKWERNGDTDQRFGEEKPRKKNYTDEFGAADYGH